MSAAVSIPFSLVLLPTPAPVAARASAFAEFDLRAKELVVGLIDFPAFCRACRPDFLRLARASARKRRPPSWVTLDDLVGMVQRHAWHYAFEHRASNGDVGHVPGKASPGAYLRWNVARRLQKDLSALRGEDQHRRDCMSATCDLEMPSSDDLGSFDRVEAPDMEEEMDRRAEDRSLSRHCRDDRERSCLAAHLAGAGDDRDSACALLGRAASRRGGEAAVSEAIRAIAKVVDELRERRSAEPKEEP